MWEKVQRSKVCVLYVRTRGPWRHFSSGLAQGLGHPTTFQLPTSAENLTGTESPLSRREPTFSLQNVLVFPGKLFSDSLSFENRATCYLFQKNTDSNRAGVERAVEPNFRFPNSLRPINNVRKPRITFSQGEKCLPFWQTRYSVTSETGDSCLVCGSRPCTRPNMEKRNTDPALWS